MMEQKGQIKDFPISLCGIKPKGSISVCGENHPTCFHCGKIFGANAREEKQLASTSHPFDLKPEQ